MLEGHMGGGGHVRGTHVEEVAMLEGHMGGGGHVRETHGRRWPC